MKPNNNMWLKRTVILSIIGFGLIFTLVIAFIFMSSIQRDTNHLKFVGISGDIEKAILNARICIEEIILQNDYTVLPELSQNLDSVRYNLEKLNSFLSSEFSILSGKDFSGYEDQFLDLHAKLTFLEKQVYPDNDHRIKVSDTLLFTAFNQFNLSYIQLGSYFPRYLISEKQQYKKEMLIVISMNSFIILLAVFLIVRLTNQLIHKDRLIIQKTIEVENRERERIAADLHDGLGSFLSSLIIHLQVMQKENEEDPVLKEKLQHLNFLSNQALRSIEEIINNLNPSYLSRNGLIKTLQMIVQKINELGKTRFYIDSEKLNIKFQGSTEVLLYRICTELINNALKHSSAKNAGFYFYNKKKQVHLLYRDDGVGFADGSESFEDHKGGLYNLMRRVESLEGTCRLQSKPDSGVEIEIIFNLN